MIGYRPRTRRGPRSTFRVLCARRSPVATIRVVGRTRTVGASRIRCPPVVLTSRAPPVLLFRLPGLAHHASLRPALRQNHDRAEPVTRRPTKYASGRLHGGARASLVLVLFTRSRHGDHTAAHCQTLGPIARPHFSRSRALRTDADAAHSPSLPVSQSPPHAPPQLALTNDTDALRPIPRHPPPRDEETLRLLRSFSILPIVYRVRCGGSDGRKRPAPTRHFSEIGEQLSLQTFINGPARGRVAKLMVYLVFLLG